MNASLASAPPTFLRGIVLIASLVALTSAPTRAQTATDVRAALAGAGRSQAVARFYAQRSYTPVWVAQGHLQPPGDSVLSFLHTAPLHGLDEAAYHLRALEELQARARVASDAARLDVLLTEAFMAYAHDLVQGRVAPRRLHPGWTLPPRTLDLPVALQAQVARGHVSPLFARLSPSSGAYRRLQGALAHYRSLAARGGWPLLSAGATLRLGMRDPRVRALRERLLWTEPLARSPAERADQFDSTLADAVRAFQERHGLAADGVAGPATLAALNVPVGQRIAQIEAGLERLRWMPDSLGARYWTVNLPAFTLTVVDNGRVPLQMRVIVGKPATPTPVFSTRATAVVLAPYWNVPTSIARAELAPRVRRDPGYLARTHTTRLPGGGYRQAPGPENPLGRLKFLVSNPFGVGLHDTPARSLFLQPVRAFSHGCMRLEQPLELAVYALQDQPRWHRAALETTIARWQEVRLPLSTPIPLYVLYQTTWVDESSGVHFRPDLYGHDARLARALADDGVAARHEVAQAVPSPLPSGPADRAGCDAEG